MIEVKQLIFDFFEENPKGLAYLIYPPQLDTSGIELTIDNIQNPHKIRFMETGIFIKQTLGYSLVTGKHLFIPYGNCVFVFNEGDVK